MFIFRTMQKHFVVSVPKGYRKLNDSLSDTEVEFRRCPSKSLNNLSEQFTEKCSIGDDVKLPLPEPKRYGEKFHSRMKLKDEVKLDLGILENSPSSPSLRSAKKIYTIDEISENMSQQSSRMRVSQLRRREHVERIFPRHGDCSTVRPISRRKPPPPTQPNAVSSMNKEMRASKTFNQSDESLVNSIFAEQFDRSSPASLEELDSPYDSIASYKKAQIHRLSNDFLDYTNRLQRSTDFDCSAHDRMTIRTYSSQQSSVPSASCFGCFTKSLRNLGRKKSTR